ncbi:hypothetical protein DFP93_106121 [Aneurinibacillus soli]|uniref:Uncharacterized protein n=1 Tax=Aneurinibacillus soli TaxID=1500254 RepID=A0A0U5B169_9BACL|nr:hypothetical protein [Aneurinibacillus soli]PYE61928.1 hypothetical protein DFP93_106121 [Aneurinibacillus soli]BAU29745.1 hypothetical protein CB4_03982 [Aneurinibacillus soli]
MKNKTTKKARITKLLLLNEDNVNYETQVDTCLRGYNDVVKKLSLDSTLQADIVFKWLYEKTTTLRSLTAKSRKKIDFEADLCEVLQLQKLYYDEELQPMFYESACKSNKSSSDIDIEMQEKKYCYSSPMLKSDDSCALFEMDTLLARIVESSTDLNQYIDKTLRLIFIDYFENKTEILNVKNLEGIIFEAIENYNKIKANKKPIDRPQNENPFLTLYQYMRNAYIKNHYNISLPDMHYFSDLKNFNVNFLGKHEYSLRDIAIILSTITTGDNMPSKPIIDRTYDKIKKSFQTNEKIQEYKEEGEYAFPNVVIPISYYLFLRKKDNRDDRKADFMEVNDKVEYRIQPILQGLLNGDNERLNTVFRYIDFVNDEYKDIMTSFNHQYQSTMLESWFETIVNIFYRIMGLNRESVYWYGGENS